MQYLRQYRVVTANSPEELGEKLTEPASYRDEWHVAAYSVALGPDGPVYSVVQSRLHWEFEWAVTGELEI